MKVKVKLAKQKSKKSKPVVISSSASSTDAEADSTATNDATSTISTEEASLAALKQATAMAQLQTAQVAQSTSAQPDLAVFTKALEGLITSFEAQKATASVIPQVNLKKKSLEFKRVDQVWDSKSRDYVYTEREEDVTDEFDCVFTVRRKFGWDNKYVETMVDIKSKVLKGVLQIIFKDCKSVSLVEDKPSIHPHFLFHYYSEIKTYVKKNLKSKLKVTKKKKEKKAIERQIRQGQLILKYISEDYENTRKALKPMLKAGK